MKRTSEVMGGHKKSTHRKAHKVHIRKAANGGFIAENHYPTEDKEEMMEHAMNGPEEHALPDMDAVHAHLNQSMGDGDGDEAPPAQAQVGPPPAQANPEAMG